MAFIFLFTSQFTAFNYHIKYHLEALLFKELIHVSLQSEWDFNLSLYWIDRYLSLHHCLRPLSRHGWMVFNIGLKVEHTKISDQNLYWSRDGWLGPPALLVRRLPPASLPVKIVGGMSAPPCKVDLCLCLKKTKNSQPSVTVFLSFLWETFSIIQIQHCQMYG